MISPATEIPTTSSGNLPFSSHGAITNFQQEQKAIKVFQTKSRLEILNFKRRNLNSTSTSFNTITNTNNVTQRNNNKNNISPSSQILTKSFFDEWTSCYFPKQLFSSENNNDTFTSITTASAAHNNTNNNDKESNQSFQNLKSELASLLNVSFGNESCDSAATSSSSSSFINNTSSNSNSNEKEKQKQIEQQQKAKETFSYLFKFSCVYWRTFFPSPIYHEAINYVTSFSYNMDIIHEIERKLVDLTSQVYSRFSRVPPFLRPLRLYESTKYRFITILAMQGSSCLIGREHSFYAHTGLISEDQQLMDVVNCIGEYLAVRRLGAGISDFEQEFQQSLNNNNNDNNNNDDDDDDDDDVVVAIQNDDNANKTIFDDLFEIPSDEEIINKLRNYRPEVVLFNNETSGINITQTWRRHAPQILYSSYRGYDNFEQEFSSSSLFLTSTVTKPKNEQHHQQQQKEVTFSSSSSSSAAASSSNNNNKNKHKLLTRDECADILFHHKGKYWNYAKDFRNKAFGVTIKIKKIPSLILDENDEEKEHQVFVKDWEDASIAAISVVSQQQEFAVELLKRSLFWHRKTNTRFYNKLCFKKQQQQQQHTNLYNSSGVLVGRSFSNSCASSTTHRRRGRCCDNDNGNRNRNGNEDEEEDFSHVTAKRGFLDYLMDYYFDVDETTK